MINWLMRILTPWIGETKIDFFSLFLVAIFMILFDLIVIIIINNAPLHIRNYDLKRIPRELFNILLNIFLGKRFLVKINGIWSVIRGKKLKFDRLRVLYGPDCHEWILSNYEWDDIPASWNKERIEKEVIERNIEDLKRKNPLKHKFDDNGPIEFVMHRMRQHGARIL